MCKACAMLGQINEMIVLIFSIDLISLERMRVIVYKNLIIKSTTTGNTSLVILYGSFGLQYGYALYISKHYCTRYHTALQLIYGSISMLESYIPI